MITFQRRTLLPVDRDTAFDISVSIDAHLNSMGGSGERAVAGVTSGTIGQGEFVTWQARHFGIRWTMTSQITTWDRPNLFVDEQTHGPFKSFKHEHRFVAADGGTDLCDCVRFEAPLGLLGSLAERLVLARYMPHLIDIRNEFLLAEAKRR